MIILAVVVLFLITIVYLISIKTLTARLKEHDPEYWNKIGQAQVFGRGEALGVLNSLYSSEMSSSSERIGQKSLLTFVRGLFPVALLLNIGLIVFIAWLVK